VILHCNGDPGEMSAICAALTEPGEAASTRLSRALRSRRTPVELDEAAALEEVARLIGRAGGASTRRLPRDA